MLPTWTGTDTITSPPMASTSDRLCHPLRRVNWAFQATLAGSTGRNNRNTAHMSVQAAPLPMPPLPAAPGLRNEEGWGVAGRYKDFAIKKKTEKGYVSLSLQSSVLADYNPGEVLQPPSCVNFLIVTKSLRPHELYSCIRHPWDFLGKNTIVGSYFLLRIFLAQGLNSGLLHCRQLLLFFFS